MPEPSARFLSAEDCAALAKHAVQLAVGGGGTGLYLESSWTGNIRFARNEIMQSTDVRDTGMLVKREVHGATALVGTNQIDDVDLEATIRRAERVLRLREESGGEAFQEHFVAAPDQPMETTQQVEEFVGRQQRQAALQSLVQVQEPYARPRLFFDTTYNLDLAQRAQAVVPLIGMARTAGVSAAGYIEASANGRAVMDTWGRAMYYPFTRAQYSVTVRDPKTGGSGWAGVDWNDWSRIDARALSTTALDKCISSRNPVAVEPGRYTVILEPQAVCDLCDQLFGPLLDREAAEGGSGPFASAKPHMSKLGERVIDERISVSADPMDPELGFVPFDSFGNVYHAVTWIDHGVLKELAYYRPYGIKQLGKNSGLPNSYAFRMSGGSTTIDEMIASTKRGLRVTRFTGVHTIDIKSGLCTGYTRDGLWLIENGKVSKPVKNFRFLDSPMFMLNSVEALGIPQRVFHPRAPVVVPPIKVREFNFSALSDAV